MMTLKLFFAYERTPDIKTSAYHDLDGFVKYMLKIGCDGCMSFNRT
jgi:hypothetical protein